jgi:anti-sigma-K factor RskA
MSEAPDLSETEAFAAEHALGVLGAAERRAAELRMAQEPEFAALVEAWRERLAPMADTLAPVAPPYRVWEAVTKALPANDNTGGRALRFWRGATAASLSLAAAGFAAAVIVGSRPPVTVQPPQPGQLLDASLVSQSGAPVPLFVAAYDPVRKALIVTSLVTANTDPSHVHELWVIPSDGKPRPLGII